MSGSLDSFTLTVSSNAVSQVKAVQPELNPILIEQLVDIIMELLVETLTNCTQDKDDQVERVRNIDNRFSRWTVRRKRRVAMRETGAKLNFAAQRALDTVVIDSISAAPDDQCNDCIDEINGNLEYFVI